jgi:hypothetical protein
MHINRLPIFLLFVAAISSGQTMTNKSLGDTLVDVFPLSIGNQWTYSYQYVTYDDSVVSCDTGSVNLHIINNIITDDSTLWSIQENSFLCHQDYSGPFSGPIMTADTFELVESHLNNHQLYRIGDRINIRKTVIPFLVNLKDTLKVYRYSHVDVNGVRTFTSYEDPGMTSFLFSFKQGVGLSSVHMQDGCTCMSGYYSIHSLRSSIITGVTNSHEYPFSRSYCLHQNYPNPFNPSTTISFTLPSRSFVSLKVFDVIGRGVVTILSEEMQAGNYFRRWNASDLPSGIYFYRLQAGSFAETKKLILLK